MSDQQETDGPVDPFVETTEAFPEDFQDPEAQERVHAFLRRYQTEGELLTGWVLLTSWSSGEAGVSAMAWSCSPDQDWFRTLGLLDAGVERLHAEYNTEEDGE